MASSTSFKSPVVIEDEKRKHLTSVGFKWFVAALLCYMDFTVDIVFLRFFTGYFVPYYACYLFELVIISLGLVNVLTCILAVFDVDVLTKKYNLFSYSLNNSMRSQQNTPARGNQLPEIIGGMLDDSLHYVSPDEKHMTAEQVYAFKKDHDVMVFPRNTMKSVYDIHNDEQLDSIWDEKEDNFAYNIFKPSYSSANYTYHHSIHEDEETNGSGNQSFIDLLDISDHFANHPDEHPLGAAQKRKPKDMYTSTPTGIKRGRLSDRTSNYSESTSNYISALNSRSPRLTRSRSRSPGFIMSQKPMIVPVVKYFVDQVSINGDMLSIMTEKLRRFISHHIVRPLAKEIKDINDFFLTNSKTLHMNIGKTPIAEIEKFCGQFQDPKLNNLPFVLAYLRLHPNYFHLVKRILTWSESDLIFDYFPDSLTLDAISWPEIFPRPKEPLPTDSELIFRLFCLFVDGQSSPYPITYPYPVDLPFTSLRTLQENKKPTATQQSEHGYYIEFSETRPMTFKFYVWAYPAIVTQPTNNALISILMLIIHAHGVDWHKDLDFIQSFFKPKNSMT